MSTCNVIGREIQELWREANFAFLEITAAHSHEASPVSSRNDTRPTSRRKKTIVSETKQNKIIKAFEFK